MFVKRTKFVCQLFPNMKVGDEIQFLGGEFIATTTKHVETLRGMKSIVKEVSEKEDTAPAEEPKEVITEEMEEDTDEVEEFKVPARWGKTRIKTEATKRGIKFPENDMLKDDMIKFLENAVNTGTKE